MIAVNTNATQISAELARIAADLPALFQDSVARACFAIEAKAKDNCPVRTGELRRSIMSEVTTNGTAIEGKVGTTLDYAPYVHEGTGIYSRSGTGRKDVPWVYCDEKGDFHTTSGVKAVPFLEDAVDEVAPDLLSFFSGVV